MVPTAGSSHSATILRILRRLQHPNIVLIRGAIIDAECIEISHVLEKDGDPMLSYEIINVRSTYDARSHVGGVM